MLIRLNDELYYYIHLLVYYFNHIRNQRKINATNNCQDFANIKLIRKGVLILYYDIHILLFIYYLEILLPIFFYIYVYF
jgi:hypothetical protein